jgi:NAD(P)H-hydrate epimerase
VVGASIHPILAVKCTEVEVACVADGGTGSLNADDYTEIASQFEEWGTVGVIGPGLGRNPGTWRLVQLLASKIELPLVIDADGLNALAENQDLLGQLGKGGRARVVTPHPGEMARLMQATIPDIQGDRRKAALEAARRWDVVVALKGAHTIVAAPDGRLSVDPHAVPALASGGTGDVLAGLIGALLAQGSEPFEATVAGVYVHAAAGKTASVGSSGLLASELLPAIPRVMELLRRLEC